MIRATACEKISEECFDEYPELEEGWVELYRKDGWVYIGYRPNEGAEDGND